MDKSIPEAAALLLDFIGDIEAPKGYNTIYGNNQNKLKKPLTSMTIAEVLAAQPGWTRQFRSSAAGRYQFMRNTLRDLVDDLKLDVNQKFDADLQDRLAYVLLRRRGYDAYINGRIDYIEFAKRLAQEWASLPVLRDTMGALRLVRRGETYYSGDGRNKSLVDPEKYEFVISAAKARRGNKDVAPAKPVRTKTIAAAAATAGAVVTGAATAPDPVQSIATTVQTLQPVTDSIISIMQIPAGALFTGLGVVGLVLGVYWVYNRFKA